MKRLMLVAAAMVLGGTVVFAQGVAEVKKEIKNMAMAQGLNAADSDEAVRSFVRLMDKGVSEAQAKNMVKLAVKKTKNAAEVDKVAAAIAEACANCGQSKEVCLIAETCLKSKISTEECARVMAATQYAYKKNADPKQLKLLTQEMLRTKSADCECLNTAIRAVGDAVEAGESSVEARLSVSRTVLAAVKDGLEGEALASRIREQTQAKTQLRDQTRERTQDRLNQELGAGEAKQEQYQQRREEQNRLQTETSTQSGDISIPETEVKPEGTGTGSGDLSKPDVEHGSKK